VNSRALPRRENREKARRPRRPSTSNVAGGGLLEEYVYIYVDEPARSSQARECSVLVGACWRGFKLRLGAGRASRWKQVEDLQPDTLKSAIDDGGGHVARIQSLGPARVFARLGFRCVPVCCCVALNAETPKRRKKIAPKVCWFTLQP